jgi:type 2 lantibiotic biosynthesis protein LanM
MLDSLSISCGGSPILADSDLRFLAAGASTLQERCAPEFLPSETLDSDLVSRRRQEWCKLAAGGDEEAFSRFLQWGSWTPAALERSLQPVTLPAPAPLPEWVLLLPDILRVYDAAPPSPAPAWLDADHPQPFADLLAPLVSWASHRLHQRASSLVAQLAPPVWKVLQRALLAQLAHVAVPTLYLEFRLFRELRESSLDRLLGDSADPAPREAYEAFIAEQRGSRLVPLLREYPVLAHYLSLLLNQWVAVHTVFLERLLADTPALAETFGNGQPLGQVCSLEMGLSDHHRGGQSVLAVSFASGVKLAYKPKDLASEAALADLLRWLMDRGAPVSFRSLRVLNRHSHGWVEWVAPSPDQTREEVQDFFRNGGGLLAVLYAINGSDCHHENVIASGVHPVLVDAETMLGHRVRPEAPLGNAPEEGSLALAASVLGTGLLPIWHIGPDRRRGFDISGLGTDEDQETLDRVWTNVNQDNMEQIVRPGRVPAWHNLPRLDGRPARVFDYRTELREGFVQTYDFLRQQRDGLLAPDGPVASLATCPIRFVFRATLVYAKLRERLKEPAVLRDGVAWSLVAQPLFRPAALLAERPRFWPVLENEVEQLLRLDIPYFVTAADQDLLPLAGREGVRGLFERAGHHLVRERLQAFSDEDRDRQLALIDSALVCRAAVGKHEQAPADRRATRPSDRPPLTDAECLVRARAIADHLRATALRGPDGSVTWIAPQHLPEAGLYQLQALDCHLYGGGGGVALFLGALQAADPAAESGALACAAIQPLRRELSEPARLRRLVARASLGAGHGVGSLLYGLVRLAGFLQRPELLDEARAIAAAVTEEQLNRDDDLDLLLGTTGLLLGLLTLHAATGDPAVLDRARSCGCFLLARRQPAPTGHRVWNTMKGKRPLTGLSHGAAGIAYALLRLHASTAEGDFRAAAAEALDYETAVFVPEAGNWPDFRELQPDQAPGFMCSWCHGAAGIVLARASALPLWDTPAVRHDLAVGLVAIQRWGLGGVDHYCCGNAGRIESLFTAGLALQRDDLTAQARVWMAELLHRSRENGGFEFYRGIEPGTDNPSLFRGTAGLGYQLLRLARPELIPSVLLLA